MHYIIPHKFDALYQPAIADMRDGFDYDDFATIDAPKCFPMGGARLSDPAGDRTFDHGFCGFRDFLDGLFCPPAGASQEVNDAAGSLAAPVASGLRVGSSDRLDLRARCVRVVQRPVPQSLSGASIQRCEQYKADIADCIQYSRTGKGLAKARFAVSRLEGIQRGAQ